MKWLILFLLFMPGVCYGQIKKLIPQTYDGADQSITWEAWETPNFEIGSYDFYQGQRVYQCVENIKTQFYNKWGLTDIKFPVTCRILCAPTQELFNSSFHLSTSNAKIYYDSKGVPNLIVLWVLLDVPIENILSKMLAIACLEEYSFIGKPVAFWAQRGIPFLYEPMDSVVARLSLFDKMIVADNKMFFSKSLLTVKEEQWQQMTNETKKLFDNQSLCLCLLFRKEYGKNVFLESVFLDMTEKNLNSVVGFSGFSELDRTFKRYMYYVSSDIKEGKMLKSYLVVKND